MVVTVNHVRRPTVVTKGAVQGAAGVEAALCQGCGTCAAECPAGAIDLMHYTDNQVMTKVDALFEEAEVGEGADVG